MHHLRCECCNHLLSYHIISSNTHFFQGRHHWDRDCCQTLLEIICSDSSSVKFSILQIWKHLVFQWIAKQPHPLTHQWPGWIAWSEPPSRGPVPGRCWHSLGTGAALVQKKHNISPNNSMTLLLLHGLIVNQTNTFLNLVNYRWICWFVMICLFRHLHATLQPSAKWKSGNLQLRLQQQTPQESYDAECGPQVNTNPKEQREMKCSVLCLYLAALRFLNLFWSSFLAIYKIFKSDGNK